MHFEIRSVQIFDIILILHSAPKIHESLIMKTKIRVQKSNYKVSNQDLKSLGTKKFSALNTIFIYFFTLLDYF